uniref:Major sperm protein n=1 Tax=Haemonchus placei TaxID=6290 RepID=A0A0N4WEJ4_HAEPC
MALSGTCSMERQLKYRYEKPQLSRVTLTVTYSHNLPIVNTRFQKRDTHFINFYSEENRTQLEFVLVRHRDRGLVTDAKTVPHETVATQHQPLIYTLKIIPPKPKLAEMCGPARIKWWRLKDKEAAVVSSILSQRTVDETWERAAEAIVRAARAKLGKTKPGRRKLDKQTWQTRTDQIRDKVREKKEQYHAFLIEKTVDNWQRYQIVKKEAEKAVVFEKAAHFAEMNEKLESRDGVYRLAKTRNRQTEDIHREAHRHK